MRLLCFSLLCATALSAAAQLLSPSASTPTAPPRLVKSTLAYQGASYAPQPLFATLPEQTPYRIPAIAVNRNGMLIAVSDYRPCGADIGYGRVDLHYRLSTDNGTSWSPEYLMAEGNGLKGDLHCGFGDAAIVADRHSDEVVVMCVMGNAVYHYPTTNRKNPMPIGRLHSTDGGRTWSEPIDATEQIYSLFDKSQLGAVDALFFGSGRICQSRIIKTGKYYRLYAALCARPGGNRVVYSDDFGRTWQILGDIHSSPAPNGDEPKVEELPDGSVLLSSRMQGGRYFNIFHYVSRQNAAGLWEEKAIATATQPEGVKAESNSTNGEVLLVEAQEVASGQRMPLLLQSVPLGPGRSRVALYYKPLRSSADYAHAAQLASHWAGPYLLSPLGSAYSTMVQQHNGLIACFYEEETYGKACYYTNVYQPVSIEQLTEGRFTAVAHKRSFLPRLLKQKPRK